MTEAKAIQMEKLEKRVEALETLVVDNHKAIVNLNKQIGALANAIDAFQIYGGKNR